MIDRGTLARIRELANSSNWMIREDAAEEIKKINDKQFEQYFPIWQEWVRDENPNIRRATEVGLLRIKKKYVEQALTLLEPLLYDTDKYVKRNCGPYALSAVCCKNSVLGFERLTQWSKDKDINVRWNIAMCLGVNFGVKHHIKALKLLRKLSTDNFRYVWIAVASSLIKLTRKYPEIKNEVLDWDNCKDCLDVVKKYVRD